MRSILHVVDIKAAPEQVFDKLTTEQGLRGWWTTDVTANPDVGGRIDFRFADQFHASMEVLAADRASLVKWKGLETEPLWQGATFTFRLEPRNDMTLLTFTQDYAVEIDDENYGRFNYNWAYYLQSLKELCETGTGFPFDA